MPERTTTEDRLRMQKQLLELQIKNMLANSIAQWVLDHPDQKDVIAAYNDWSAHVARRGGFPNDHETTIFELEMFDCCINHITAKLLKAYLEMDRRDYTKARRF